MGSETSGLMIGRCLRDGRPAAEPLATPLQKDPRPPRSGLLLSRPAEEVTLKVDMGPTWVFRVEPDDMRLDADGEEALWGFMVGQVGKLAKCDDKMVNAHIMNIQTSKNDV